MHIELKRHLQFAPSFTDRLNSQASVNLVWGWGQFGAHAPGQGGLPRLMGDAMFYRRVARQVRARFHAQMHVEHPKDNQCLDDITPA